MRHHPLNRRTVLSATAALLAPAALRAQGAGVYPARPVELVVPASAGGGTDILARLFAESARPHFAQPLTVVNKPGASATIGMGEIAHARPDGYKIGMVVSELAIMPHLGIGKFGPGDFRPIAGLNVDPAGITVRADAPWATLEEFLAAAKARPGALRVGNSGAGSVFQFAAMTVENKVDVRFTHVPYQGAAPSVLALLGGHIDAVSVSVAEASQHILSGKLRCLGVMSDRPLKGFDKVPTLQERGLDVQVSVWRGLAAPKGTPDAVVDVLRGMARKTAAEEAFRAGMERAKLGLVYTEADAFAAMVQKDSEDFKRLITAMDFKL